MGKLMIWAFRQPVSMRRAACGVLTVQHTNSSRTAMPRTMLNVARRLDRHPLTDTDRCIL